MEKIELVQITHPKTGENDQNELWIMCECKGFRLGKPERINYPQVWKPVNFQGTTLMEHHVPERLYSGQTVNNTVKFEEIARRIEDARRKFEARKENEAYKILRSLEDRLQNLGEVFDPE